MLIESEKLSFKEYKEIQARNEYDTEQPPCVFCPEFVYNRCRDKGIECIKFIEYCDPDKRSEKRARDYIRFKERKANGYTKLNDKKSARV